MRNYDEEHHAVRRETGFFGRAGAGVVFLARRTGRLMVGLRSEIVLEPGTWGTFGGAIDPDEDPRDAALREVVEETGYDHVERLVPLLVFRNDVFTYHNFLAVVDEEFEPELSAETDDHVWLTLPELVDLPDLHFGLRHLLSNEETMRTLERFRARDLDRSTAPRP